jgi:hypothetical protein
MKTIIALNMSITSSQALVLGGILSAAASLAHLACIAIGAPAYRLLGAGEAMARAAEAGQLQPTLVTLAIAAVLALWAGYAFAGAGLLRPLPLMKLALPTISLVLLARALGYPLLRSAFPENSELFWWLSSAICLLMGALYAFGTWARWSEL